MKKLVKKSMKRCVAVSLSLALGLGCFVTDAKTAEMKDVATQTAANERQRIDAGIRGLNYNKYEILSNDGEKVKSFVSKEGIHNNGKFIVIERQKKSLTTSPVDISVINSVIDRTYPGALQLANRDLVENKPALLMAERNPIDITVNLPGLKNDNTITVENPNYGNVTKAIDKLVDKWSAEHSSTHTLPSQLQYTESMVYSKSQISTALNVNADFLEKSLGIDFKAIGNGEKKVMVAAFKQIFYNVTANLPNKPSDLFADNVTIDDLKAAGMNDDNPPVMVSNVSYGRTIYVKLETSSKSKDVEAAFKALIKKVKAESSNKYSEILENSSFTAVVLGGDSQKHSQIITKNFDEIVKVIKDNSEFSIRNPGYPISYTATLLKDNSIAMVNNVTEYIETTATEYNSGAINLKHTGGFVAQFEITWDEVSYDASGNEVLEKKAWNGNWADKTAPFYSTISLPANARNIRIFARECTGLAWEWWRDIVNEKNVPLTSKINVNVSGTTLVPYYEIVHEK